MSLAIFSLAFNAMPFIERQLPIFQKLQTPWHWYVVHGASMNGGSTAWCQKQKPGLSTDGTTQYLHSIDDDRVTVIEKKSWPSKDAMCNAALERIKEPCVLMQIDADEIWQPEQLDKIASILTPPDLVINPVSHQTPASITFACRYFVGPKLITSGEDCFGDHSYEWRRAWRYQPEQRFISHEPPVLENNDNAIVHLSKRESRELGLAFDHFAYTTEDQVEYKSRFYGYGPGLVESWRKLQEHDKFPTDLNRFFPWLKPNEKAQVVRV